MVERLAIPPGHQNITSVSVRFRRGNTRFEYSSGLIDPRGIWYPARPILQKVRARALFSSLLRGWGPAYPNILSPPRAPPHTVHGEAIAATCRGDGGGWRGFANSLCAPLLRREIQLSGVASVTRYESKCRALAKPSDGRFRVVLKIGSFDRVRSEEEEEEAGPRRAAEGTRGVERPRFPVRAL